MPATLPAHAVAILPLVGRNRWFQPSALFIGCITPDLVQVVGIHWRQSHYVPNALVYGLALGLLGLWWLEALILPFFVEVLPTVLWIDWPRICTTRGLPQTPSAWISAVASILVGLATHLALDGITHCGYWPGRWFCRRHPDLASILPMLWRGISVLGTMIVLGFLVRRFPAPLRPLGGRPRAALILLVTQALVVFWAIWIRSPVPGIGRATTIAGPCLTVLSLLALFQPRSTAGRWSTA